MKITKLLVALMIVLMMLTMLVACNEQGPQGVQGEQGERGEQGLPGKDGADGKDGEDGVDGKDGATPTIEISADGYWVINGTKTEHKAIGTDGIDGATPIIAISVDGYWVINGVKTENKAIGTDGEDGKNGKDGKNGVDGAKGETGVGIEKVEYDDNGNLVITYTDGSKQTLTLPEKDEHIHNFGEWIPYGAENVHCDKALFYRICADCHVLEWKTGTEDDHTYITVTTAPTCTKEGYDTKTCSKCNKVVVCNETVIIDHHYSEEYTSNNAFHWYQCNTCDNATGKAEHTLGEDGICTVCDAVIGATEGLIYDVSADGTYAEVVGYTGAATRVKIAEEYNGLPVKTICDKVFCWNHNINTVIIPDGVTSIGDYAFSGCYYLMSITIPDSVTSIGDYAFASCGLRSVTLPKCLTSIGNGAFKSSRGIASITIPDSTKYIGSYAFEDCNTALYTTFEYGSYVGDSENPYQALIGLTNENFSTYTIHEDTKVIAYGVFFSHARLTNITLPDGLTSISTMAFGECSNLTSIVIPDSVTSIGDDAFYCCSSLTSINFGGTIEQWNSISKGNGWALNTGSYTIYCTDGKISKNGTVTYYPIIDLPIIPT